MRREAGFSLLELLLSVAIIGIVVGLSLPVYQSFTRRNDLDLAVQDTAQLVRRAQAYARGMNEDSAWSVHTTATAITLYKGTNYDMRDTTDDETIPVSSPLTASGPLDINFAKLTGVPNNTGTITLTSLGSSKGVSINAKGMVQY